MNQLAPHLHSCSADILTEKGIPVSRSSPLPLSTGGGARPAGSDAEDPYHPAPIRCFLILPALLCLLVLCACSTVEENRRINKIKTFTSEYFTTLLASTPENQELWDMQSFTIFGYGSIPFFEIPIASPGVRIHKSAEDPLVYEVVKSFWIEGEDSAGERLRLKRKLHFELRAAGDEGAWRVLRAWYTDDTPLSTWEQAGRFAFWSLLGPLILGLATVGILQGFLPSGANLAGCVRLTTLLVALPLAGYAAFVCFGSGVSVLISLAVYLGFALLLYTLFQRVLQSRQ